MALLEIPETYHLVHGHGTFLLMFYPDSKYPQPHPEEINPVPLFHKLIAFLISSSESYFVHPTPPVLFQFIHTGISLNIRIS